MAMTLADNALVGLDEARVWCGVGHSDDDEILTRLINTASSRIEQYCKRAFHETTYTEYYDGDGTSKLLLKHYPIASVDHLYIDTDREYDTDSEVDSDDYVIYSNYGLLALDGDLVFSEGEQSVKVVYKAGYDAIPEDLQTYCLMLVEWMYDTRLDGRLGVSTESDGVYRASYLHDDMPPEIKAGLANYRNIKVG